MRESWPRGRLRVVAAEDEPLSQQRLGRLLRERADLELVALCSTAAEVEEHLGAGAVDLAVLDIEMPGCSGLELAGMTRDHAEAPEVVFVTAYAEFAVEAFAIRAADYVLKPYSRERLFEALDRAIELFRAKRAASPSGEASPAPARVDRFVVYREERSTFVPFARVESVHASTKEIHIIASGQKLAVRMPLWRALELLPSPPFYQVSRSAVVNTNFVESMHELFNGTAEMVMKSGRTVAVSRRFRRALRRTFERPENRTSVE